MKIMTVNTYKCDAPACGATFQISNKKGPKTLHIDSARVYTNNMDYHNANGMTFCPGCTTRILQIIGGR